ncbi:uncharacterized protein LOC111805888 [Cucurbita pepo subsp. pepo]|uniref:uncharacterized protein LOC111805888 n=1 Tax=Cucurbita pepo subsp. pepo TaxID=3664 RepID=UPI000C9D2F95|nr:uncharacterized protein LOC111805888 [Cucurbita pepo subsp. pepo]
MGNTMGGVCSNGIDKDYFESEKITQTSEDRKGNSCLNSEAIDPNEMQQRSRSGGTLLLSPPSKTGSNKVAPVNSQAGSRGRAIDLLKTIGNSVSNLHMNGGFFTGMASNGREISILAFEVANTISKVANLSQSLSEENIQLLKEELLQSEGIKQLVSTSSEELLSIAAADKRQEFDVLLREVIRFGKQCKDPQWHNLDQYFSRLDLNDSSKKQAREARAAIQELAVLAQSTSELYHELLALERFEQDYRRKVDEVESMNQAGIGESLSIFQGELNVQRKLVRSFQSKCLWSRSLDEIVEKLVIVVTWINQTIAKTFDDHNTGACNGPVITDKTLPIEDRSNGQKLGSVGLALHYANIISQINLIACRPTSIPSNMRDALYRALPISVKIGLRSRLRTVHVSEEPTYIGVKAEMDKILEWLVPIAANTSKAHQACGRIGEWATQSKEHSKGRATQSNPIRLQTLFHADRVKTEQQILELVTLLHHLIHLAKQQPQRFTSLRCQSPTPKNMAVPQPYNARRIQFKSQIIKANNDGITPTIRKRDPSNNKGTESYRNDIKDKGIWTLSKGFSVSTLSSLARA